MKHRLLILLLSFWSIASAQRTDIPSIINGKVIKIPLYSKITVPAERSFTIPCDFGKDVLRFPDSIDLERLQVTAVDLVFTDYPTANDLKKLNTGRLLHLFDKYPKLLNMPGIEWKLVRQMDGAEREKAAGLFHGFVVYYRPVQDKKTMREDLDKLKEMLAPLPGTGLHLKRNAFIAIDTTHLRERYEIEPYTIVKKMTQKEALLYIGLNEKEKNNYPGTDSVFVFEIPGDDSTRDKLVLRTPEDSTVAKVFNRMRWPKMLVVADVTASMYPYTGQLLVWMKLHEEERDIRQFVFFNDGDDLEEEKKLPGRTGGIYVTNSSVFEVVEQTAFTAMSRGNGGGIPENNLEAVLHGISACPGCRSVVMIADNASPVSDMSLLNQVNRPVHIILCGVHEAINPDHLAIARATGGSVHLMNEDLNDLAALKEGETFVIAGRTYVIRDERFVLKK